MADNIETSQWEPGIYQLETTDEVMGGVGGVSNRPNVELGNRSAHIKTTLDFNGIYVVGGEHQYTGQNIDVTAVFEGTVANGDAVAWNNGNLRYEKVMSPANSAGGIADVTNGRVISGGMLLHSALPAGSVQGSTVYLSPFFHGELTLTEGPSVVGQVLWKTSSTVGVILVTPGSGRGTAHSALYDDEASKHFTEASILHSAINNDQMSIHTSSDLTIGMLLPFVAGNTPPAGYLHCNGALVSRFSYPDLWSGHPMSIGYRFGGSGDNFYLPDFRGRACRGWANGNARDPDRASRYADMGGIAGDNPGSMQADMLEWHLHYPYPGYANFMTTTGSAVGSGGDSYGRMDYTNYAGGGTETRMQNFSAMWIIRYQ
jgi:microcystin-dependent protein